MAHTPGPWRFGQDGKEPYWHVDMPRQDGSPGYGAYNAMVYTTEADARLVAAAPEMLGFLHQIADECRRRLRKGSDSGDLLTLQLCYAAISKAQGGDAWDASMVGQTPR